jgi:putative hydrolase of the HAD superfamily
VISAALFDFGGVILSSPFEAFNRYEHEHGLPVDFIRTVNSRDEHSNAWARLERSEIDASEFDWGFAEESTALGHCVRGADVLALLAGEVRPEMVVALHRVKACGLALACLTNNIVGGMSRPDIDEVLGLFDVIVESSKVGVRKPERRFYEIACEQLGVDAADCVFLDDLGVNLKPARDMGMTTIKVASAEQAIAELETVLGVSLR